MTTRRLTHASRIVAIAAVFSALTATSIAAQAVRGIIVDSINRVPVPRASVSLFRVEPRKEVGRVIASDSGKFFIVAPDSGRYALEVKRIGFDHSFTVPFTLRKTDTLALKVQITQVVLALDSMVTSESRMLGKTTPGALIFAKHQALGKGMFITGEQIQKSGMSASEYLGHVDGLKLTDLVQKNAPMLPAEKGAFVTSSGKENCIYAKIDHYSAAYMLINLTAETLDDLIGPSDIKGVEVYRDKSEAPDEWKADVMGGADIYTRENGGREYVIGHIGRPPISSFMIEEDSTLFHTHLVGGPSSDPRPVRSDKQIVADNGATARGLANALASQPPCGLIQIWTYTAW